jgi:hypothetical protein
MAARALDERLGILLCEVVAPWKRGTGNGYGMRRVIRTQWLLNTTLDCL